MSLGRGGRRGSLFAEVKGQAHRGTHLRLLQDGTSCGNMNKQLMQVENASSLSTLVHSKTVVTNT